MKRLLVYIVVLLMALPAMAQQHRLLGKGRTETVAVGLRLGVNSPRYRYLDDSNLDNLPMDYFYRRLRPVVGVNVELPFAKVLYVAPEVTWVGRGDARLFESSVWDTLVRYQAKTNYLEFRLPLSLALPVSKTVKPYVFVSPSIGVTLPLGYIKQYSLDTVPLLHDSIAIDTNNMALYDVGVTFGAGLRYVKHFEAFSLVIKAEVGWYCGLRDTYSPMEHLDQPSAVNVHAYNINGSRKNRGLEASITVALPLRFYPDACSFDGRSRLF